MKLHLLGIPHTITSPEYSHCAFTGKVLRFGPMMRDQGYEVIHYGNGRPDVGVEHVEILSKERLDVFTASRKAGEFYGDLVDLNSVTYRQFNDKLREELDKRISPRDIICFPFGSAHAAAVRGSVQAASAFWVESGIGYEDRFCDMRVFESYAWLHWHHGRYQYPGSDYEWVVPNYFDEREWEFNPDAGEYVLYFGRIYDAKGLDIVVEIARARPDLKFVLCGQGDPKPYLYWPNITYMPPVTGLARSDVIRKAIAVLCPTRYIEPFGGVAIEAMLCGRPVLASHFGAFSETLWTPRLHTLADWLEELRRAEAIVGEERADLRECARSIYSTVNVGPMYDRVFKQISDLAGQGWFTVK